jgi:phosphoglucomutase
LNGRQEYQKWLNDSELPKALREELVSIQGNEQEIEDRFGKTLDFGTGGLRGVMGAGLNRMNIYTVRRASWAFAQYILRQGTDATAKGVAIGYDCRHMSAEFAREAGLTMAAVGVHAYVSPYLCPTPEVSFSVRHFQAAGGVMITASHNPPEYNGYKAYGPDGAQLLPDVTSEIHAIMMQHPDVFELPTMALDEAIKQGRFQWIARDVRSTYVDTVVRTVQFPSISQDQRKALTVVYTPLHGAGNVPVREALHAAGYEKVHIVQEQEEPNGDFPTVKSPNPEEPKALELGTGKAREVFADLVMGTDPDSDRVGIAVRSKEGEYQLLTGNQVGALLMEFILRTRQAEGRLPKNGIVFQTIVSSDLGRTVAASFDVPTENTLTGFKYIGHGITRYEQTGEHTFLFGYEESYGYLVSPIVRDKDAVQTCLAIAEMVSFYKSQDKTLLDALHALFARFGHYREALISVPLQQKGASNRVQSVMDGLRQSTPSVEGLRLVAIEDYKTSRRSHVDASGQETSMDTLQLPKSDVLKYLYEDGSWMAIRPSGTEPKIKVYLAARGQHDEDCKAKIQHMQRTIEQHLQ